MPYPLLHKEGMKALDDINKQLANPHPTPEGHLRMILKALAVIIGILLSK